MQLSPRADHHADLLSLVAAYLDKVGVKVEIQTLEYAAFLSAMTTRTNAPGYFMNNGHTNPTTSLRKNFVHGPGVEPVAVQRPGRSTRRSTRCTRSATSASARSWSREMTREIVDKAPYIWLPTQYVYRAGGRG